MIRITKMSGKYYGIDTDITDEKEQNNIEEFINTGVPIILVNDLEDLEDLGIDFLKVIMVEKE